ARPPLPKDARKSAAQQFPPVRAGPAPASICRRHGEFAAPAARCPRRSEEWYGYACTLENVRIPPVAAPLSRLRLPGLPLCEPRERDEPSQSGGDKAQAFVPIP